MGRKRLTEWLISELSELRDGGLAGADSTLNRFMSHIGLEMHSRAIAGSAKVCWVADIHDDAYLRPGFLSGLDSYLRRITAIQTSLNGWLERGRRMLLYSLGQSCLDGVRDIFPEEPYKASIPSNAVVVSTLVLLSLVYQYLTGNDDRSGSKAYSRGSLDFRDAYVAIILFLGAYVWIKFREVAFKGVHRRTLVDKQGGTKVVYEARLTPPMCSNGEKVPRLDLGRFATPQEAHNKFLIAAFYYNRGAGLLDGWFLVPPMSEEERSFSGLEKRKWVIGQAKTVYEDFRKRAKALAALEQELSKGCEGHATPGHDEVNVDACRASLLNSAGHQQPPLASQVKNSGVGMGMIGDSHALECASRSFDGRHEGLALPNGRSLGSQEGSALPVSQLPPNTERGMSLDGSDQLISLQTLVHTLQQQISNQQQQIWESGDQISLLQQLQLQEPMIQNPHRWPCQFCLQQQQLQVVNQGVPGFEVEMEQSMRQHNYPGLMAPPPDGAEVQESFWEMDTLL